MRPENVQAVQVLRDKIRAKEDEANKLKMVVNGFYADENEPLPYPNLTNDASASLHSLRTDQFYGRTLAEAAKEYLDMRKVSSLSSASVNEIYAALKAGGYNFDTANEEYAKNGVRISLRKNPTIFHKLPNGDYGLCSWYGVKGRTEEDNSILKRAAGKRRKKQVAAKQAGLPKADSPKTEKDNPMPQAKAASGIFSPEAFESWVREKNRRMKDVMAHFGANEATIKTFLEPATKVYQAERGWLKVRG